MKPRPAIIRAEQNPVSPRVVFVLCDLYLLYPLWAMRRGLYHMEMLHVCINHVS